MILLTGTSGLLGSYILEALCKEYAATSIVAVYHHHIPYHQFSGVHYEQIDLLDIMSVEALYHKYDIDTVIHAAAMVSFQPKDRDRLLQHNKRITENLVNTSLRKAVRKFIHISSIAALNRESTTGFTLIDEKDYLSNYKGMSAYGISKHLSEMEVWRAHAEGLPVVILNPGIILGYHPSDTSSASLFLKVQKGLKYYTDGITSFVGAVDVARVVILCITSDKGIGERFIISAGNYSYGFILQSIASSLGVPPPNVKARKWQSELLWRLSSLISFFTKKKPLITKETARTAHSVYHFSNDKFLSLHPTFSYNSIEKLISSESKKYLV